LQLFFEQLEANRDYALKTLSGLAGVVAN